MSGRVPGRQSVRHSPGFGGLAGHLPARHFPATCQKRAISGSLLPFSGLLSLFYLPIGFRPRRHLPGKRDYVSIHAPRARNEFVQILHKLELQWGRAQKVAEIAPVGLALPHVLGTSMEPRSREHGNFRGATRR